MRQIKIEIDCANSNQALFYVNIVKSIQTHRVQDIVKGNTGLEFIYIGTKPWIDNFLNKYDINYVVNQLEDGSFKLIVTANQK